MNGGYRGGQGSGRGSGYGGLDGEDAYGAPSRPAQRRPAGGQRPRDDSGWQRDTDGTRQGGGTGGYAGQGYDRPGYRAQDGAGRGPAGQQGYPGPGYDGQGYGRHGGRPGTGGSPGYRPQRRAAQAPPPGYDQLGSGPRRMAGGGYEDDYRYGQGGNYDSGDDSFLPGFGGRDDYDGRGPGRDPRDRDRRDRDRRDRDRRDRDRRDRDPRDLDARDGNPRGRGPGGPGGRGSGGRGPDDWGPDPRGRDGGWRDRDGRDTGDREAWSEYHTEKRRRSPIRRLAPWVALLIIVVPIAIGLTYIYHRYEAKYHPADYAGPGTGEVTVQVMSGDTAFSLAPRLVSLGVIASARAFENAAEAAPANGPTIEPGYFELRHHMKASLAYAYLTNPKNMLKTVVTIPEGKRVSQVISILAAQTKIPARDFQNVIDHPAQLGLPSYAKGVKGYPDSAVEGFLFPATYAITPHETALQILKAMVARFNVEAQAINLPAAAKSVHLTPYQLIIEASMAQAEGGSVSDYPKIATVIRNRQAAGMVMGFDSVLFYGLNTYGINVTAKQEAIDTPYNDLKYHKGLPPTPIDNPGNAAIQGILHPKPGNWLYFLTKTGGKSTFSHTPLPGQ